MSRGKKLLIVGFVLAVGLGLAWPFRKAGDEPLVDSLAGIPQAERSATATTMVRQPIQAKLPSTAPAPHVVAKVPGFGQSSKEKYRSHSSASFDLANHPAIAGSQGSRSASPVTPATPPRLDDEVPSRRQLPVPLQQPAASSSTRPVYATTGGHVVIVADEQDAEEVRHVVQNSDTLEKIAKRYLGDAGRAFEIFDLNRDVLDNPHLLPINAELRIPDGKLTARDRP